LRSRIAYRETPNQLDFYESKRWTESPDAYTRRALEHVLVDARALVTGGVARELQVEVLAFEEVRNPGPAGRVTLLYRLIDNRVVVRAGVIDVERPASQSFESIVVAIGEALDEASTRVVSEALR
jgi:hypothetical protein